MNTSDSPMISPSMIPSIWRASYTSGKEWIDSNSLRAEVSSTSGQFDDAMLHPRRPNLHRVWCAACDSPTETVFHWQFGAVDPDGSLRPAWTETGVCTRCGLNSRMRALVALVKDLNLNGKAFLAECLTPAHQVLSTWFRSVIASEYLGAHLESGASCEVEMQIAGSPHTEKQTVRHEDLTRLSLDSESVDVVITQDVFEHIPEYRTALKECHRILRPGGSLVFTIPFFSESMTTNVRAIVRTDGSVEHLAEPEIHGNPLGGGSLCFQHFGWDILDELRSAGFSHAAAHSYWGPWQGHVLGPSFVFTAQH